MDDEDLMDTADSSPTSSSVEYEKYKNYRDLVSGTYKQLGYSRQETIRRGIAYSSFWPSTGLKYDDLMANCLRHLRIVGGGGKYTVGYPQELWTLLDSKRDILNSYSKHFKVSAGNAIHFLMWTCKMEHEEKLPGDLLNVSLPQYIQTEDSEEAPPPSTCRPPAASMRPAHPESLHSTSHAGKAQRRISP
jgi:hypothetical protein